ncbi:unnamed protein product [Hymenolepis diminuta]|uniref:Uncharacterized protein n=2 Tax=Hymenolepis diminuta TaxID=6216 RepID=A0A564YXB3_HYMDI|nr:unnamed protein product [Hymenolepis diminuta]
MDNFKFTDFFTFRKIDLKMSDERQESSVERRIGAKSPSKPPTPSKKPNDILHIDIIPSHFLITPKVEDCLRKIAIQFVSFIKKKYSQTRAVVTYPQCCGKSDSSNSFVQVYKNPQIWKCYPKFNVHDRYESEYGQMSAYAQSWESIHTIFSQFLTYRSCVASIPSLAMGLCPATDQTFMKNLSSAKSSTYPFDLRLAVPTLHPDVGCLLATPPSLPWSLSVALEFFRLQAMDGEERGCDKSNLTTNTVGVLQNWIDFMLYGTLIESEDEKTNYLSEDWIRTTSKSSAQSNSAFPAVMTLVFDCSSLIPPETFPKNDLDEQLVKLDKAWQDAVQVSAQQSRGTILISSKQLENAGDLEKLFDEVDTICHKRFAQSKAHRGHLERMEIDAASA